MRPNLFFIIALLTSILVSAHPGIGIVYDGQRFIYYTDLSHVWKLDTQSGLSEIAVKDVHSHELYLDQSGNLYGEHYWYDASAQSFKNYIWQLDHKGVMRKVREEISGENTDFGFVRDSLFRSYRIQKADGQFAIVRSDSLNADTLYMVDLQKPGWMYFSQDGYLYFTDDHALFVLQKDQLIKLGSNLNSTRFPFSLQADQHNLYGIWEDKDQHIYLANYGGRLVKRITRDGKVSKVLKSDFFWSPVNGVYDKEQRLWLMESSVLGKVRLREIKGTLNPKNWPFLLENIFIALFSLFLIAGLYDLIIKRIFRVKR